MNGHNVAVRRMVLEKANVMRELIHRSDGLLGNRCIVKWQVLRHDRGDQLCFFRRKKFAPNRGGQCDVFFQSRLSCNNGPD